MLSKILKGKEVILASQSPRRKELLQGLNLKFRTMSMAVDETYPHDMPANEVAGYLAQKKAVAYSSELKKNSIIITADTIVIVEDVILEKPENEQEAADMLTQLSGKVHEVMTGVCVKSLTKTKCFTVSTKVHFKALTVEEIFYYVHQYKPFDKAGSYGIQEWIGYIGVNSIEGSYFNVMGLPVFELNEVLMSWNNN